jgi:hypothetical protein
MQVADERLRECIRASEGANKKGLRRKCNKSQPLFTHLVRTLYFSDFPGASGMAYRYIDNSPADGWVFGGWSIHGSAVARVAANGTVLWSHKMNYVIDGKNNSATVLQSVCANADGGATFVGFSYNIDPGERYCFVSRLAADGSTIYSIDLGFHGAYLGCSLEGVATDPTTKNGVLVVGIVPNGGAFSARLGPNGKQLSAWALNDDIDGGSVEGGGNKIKALHGGGFAYSFNSGVPNTEPTPRPHPRRATDMPTYWGLMRLDATGKPISAHDYDNTIWGHNSEMTIVPAAADREAGFVLAGNLEDTRYGTSILVVRVSADFKTVIWSRKLAGK